MEKDKLICTCMEVWKSEIVRAIKEKKLTTVEEVGEETGAGKVCGECIPEIEELLQQTK